LQLIVSCRFLPPTNSRVLKKLLALSPSSVTTHIALSPSPWVLLRLLQALFQYYDVRCFSMASTIVIGSRACVCTCVVFDFGIFSRASFHAHLVPAEPVITEKCTTAKEKLLTDYEDHLASYESQFHVYRTWLDEDARVGSVLTASMEDRLATDIVGF
jgi:hypothetical protein